MPVLVWLYFLIWTVSSRFLIFKYGGFLVIPLLTSTLSTLYSDTDFNPLKMVKICWFPCPHPWSLFCYLLKRMYCNHVGLPVLSWTLNFICFEPIPGICTFELWGKYQTLFSVMLFVKACFFWLVIVNTISFHKMFLSCFFFILLRCSTLDLFHLGFFKNSHPSL